MVSSRNTGICYVDEEMGNIEGKPAVSFREVLLFTVYRYIFSSSKKYFDEIQGTVL